MNDRTDILEAAAARRAIRVAFTRDRPKRHPDTCDCFLCVKAGKP